MHSLIIFDQLNTLTYLCVADFVKQQSSFDSDILRLSPQRVAPVVTPVIHMYKKCSSDLVDSTIKKCGKSAQANSFLCVRLFDAVASLSNRSFSRPDSASVHLHTQSETRKRLLVVYLFLCKTNLSLKDLLF